VVKGEGEKGKGERAETKKRRTASERMKSKMAIIFPLSSFPFAFALSSYAGLILKLMSTAGAE
jgi:hypothetical protein